MEQHVPVQLFDVLNRLRVGGYLEGVPEPLGFRLQLGYHLGGHRLLVVGVAVGAAVEDQLRVEVGNRLGQFHQRSSAIFSGAPPPP